MPSSLASIATFICKLIQANIAGMNRLATHKHAAVIAALVDRNLK